MSVELPLNSGLALRLGPSYTNHGSFPTTRIQKGLVLLDEGTELCEESVGFGVPVFKYGLRAIFPGELELTPFENKDAQGVIARYTMNLEEKIGRPGSAAVKSPILYESKNILAAMIRHLPWLRRLLTNTSSLLRTWLSLETTYEPSEIHAQLSMTYAVDAPAGRIKIAMLGNEQKSAGLSEVILMNEQGAHFFDHYEDADGTRLIGEKIGCWDQVSASEAAFTNHTHSLSFSLPQVTGAKLYRGRELVGTRLAWAGFGYTYPPTLEHFSYEITVKKST